MKDLFPGYFKESKGDLREVWDTSLFVFDANILLNLYRYSDTTQSEFLRILDKVKSRVWLPHRAAEEYLNNRLPVIDQQEKSYDDTKRLIESLKSDLENSRQHPFVSAKTMSRVGKVFDDLCEELEKNKSVHTKRISDDDIKKSIASIFESRVGSPYEKKKLEEIISEGEERYKQKIPPGFKDSSKSADSDTFSEKCRKYGDLIVWLQVIDKAIESGKGIVLVTDDKKEDWWERFKGKTIGPRPELVKEFKDRTNNTFHMYQADRFLELARENLGEQVSEDAVEEIREIKRLDKLTNKRLEETEHRLRQKHRLDRLLQELAHTKRRMDTYAEERRILQERLRDLALLQDETARLRDNALRNDIKDSELDLITRRNVSLSERYTQARENWENAIARHNETQMQLMALEKETAQHMRALEEENAEDLDWTPSDRKN